MLNRKTRAVSGGTGTATVDFQIGAAGLSGERIHSVEAVPGSRLYRFVRSLQVWSATPYSSSRHSPGSSDQAGLSAAARKPKQWCRTHRFPEQTDHQTFDCDKWLSLYGLYFQSESTTRRNILDLC